MEDQFEVRIVLPKDDEQVSTLLAETFFDSPSYGPIFRPSNRFEGLRWLFQSRLAILRDLEGFTVGIYSKSDNEWVSTVSFGNIFSQTPSIWMKLKHGVLLFPFLWGFDSLSRAIEIGESHTKFSLDTNGQCDWEIMMVATNSNFRKRGFAGRLLNYCINYCQNLPSPNPLTIGLSTFSEENVTFYRRFGFEVTGHQILDESIAERRHPVWAMKKNV